MSLNSEWRETTLKPIEEGINIFNVMKSIYRFSTEEKYESTKHCQKYLWQNKSGYMDTTVKTIFFNKKQTEKCIWN